MEEDEKPMARIANVSAMAAVLTCVLVCLPQTKDNHLFIFAPLFGYAAWHVVMAAKRDSWMVFTWSIPMLIFAAVMFFKNR